MHYAGSAKNQDWEFGLEALLRKTEALQLSSMEQVSSELTTSAVSQLAPVRCSATALPLVSASLYGSVSSWLDTPSSPSTQQHAADTE